MAYRSYAQGSTWQQTAAEQCFRFFDSQPDYAELQLDTLLSAIQANPPAQRNTFFEGVAGCRRRRKLDTAKRQVRGRRTRRLIRAQPPPCCVLLA